MAPSDGNAVIAFSLAAGRTLQAAADSTLKALGVTVKESKSTSLNGLPAITTLSTQTGTDSSTGAQITNEILSYFIEFNGNHYVFHGASTEANFSKYSSLMKSTMTSFARVTDSFKLNVKPDYIRIKKVTKAVTLADTFKSFGVPSDKYTEYALMNEMELTDNLQAGQLIKIVTK